MISLLLTLHAHAFPAAPALTVGQWLSSPPVAIEDEGVVIVELWATWCGPCIDALPHLSALAEHYEGQVSVAAISDERERVVSRFLDRRGPFSFSAGVDASGATTQRFMAIDKADGIPRTYIVQDGEVVWSGHPMEIDPVIATVVAGRWTPAHAERYRVLPEMFESYFDDVRAGKTSNAAATGAELVTYGELYPGMLNNFSWMILTEVSERYRDVPLALSAAEKACGLEPESAAYLDTLAVALHQSQRLDEAIAVQERAVAALSDGDPARSELQGRLEQFRRQRDEARPPAP